MTDFKIIDGAMGSELIKRGLTLPKHIWSAEANLTNPAMVKQIHKEYIEAGADYITTNTFRTTPRAYNNMCKRISALEHSIQQARTSLYNAVDLAKKTISNSVEVIGSIAPLEDCYSPELFPGKNIAISEFSQLGGWLIEAGVDILLLETMNSIIETEAGLIALKKFKYPIWVSFVLKDEDHLLSGDSIVDALKIAKGHFVECVMLNCNPLNLTIMALDNIVDNWDGKWGVYPNLGIGGPSPDGNIFHYEKINYFISTIEKIIEKDPFILGGCCGSSPYHITELLKLRNKLHVVSDSL